MPVQALTDALRALIASTGRPQGIHCQLAHTAAAHKSFKAADNLRGGAREAHEGVRVSMNLAT
jgi:hypothetical protein